MKTVTFTVALKDSITGGLSKISKFFKTVADDAEELQSKINGVEFVTPDMSRIFKPVNLNNFLQVADRLKDTFARIGEAGMTFEQSIADLQSITGIAGAELDSLTDNCKKFGAESGFGAAEVARSYSLLASQIEISKIGMDGLNSLQEKTITLAQASGMSMEASANALAGTINQFGLSADEADRVINVLAAGSKYGAAEIEDLSQSFKEVGASASAMGLTVESTAGALEILSQANLTIKKMRTKNLCETKRLNQIGNDYLCYEIWVLLKFTLFEGIYRSSLKDFVMSNKYRYIQRLRQRELLGTPIFGNDKGGGVFKGKRYDFVLNNSDFNLFPPIVDTAKHYFSDNSISWWAGNNPSGHILSSQIACLNHLMPIMHDKNAVLTILNGIKNEFVDIFPIGCDKRKGYIAFEVVSKNQYLNEKNLSRGSNCTSIDALIYAKHRSGQNWIIPIEWKYTEYYETHDMSIDDRYNEPKGTKGKGLERQKRYNNLITDSAQLKTMPNYESSIYYQEPFYQLMRQTLWAEEVIKHNNEEFWNAHEYLHLHIIPKENKELLHKKYKVSGMDMETTWRSCLNNQEKYLIIDPKELFMPISEHFAELTKYLSLRYW